MPSPQLANYLRSIRKRKALSQAEVAFLLGNENGAQISRHEQMEIVPNLKTALEYEAIFKIPVSEIFGGLYQQAERNVAERAEILVRRTNSSMRTANAVKRDTLTALASV